MKTIESAFITLLMVLASIAVYNLFLKPYTPTKVQGWIGLGS